ncbi:MAG: TRZ/ATZ family hydrolase, partial [Dokdonella sp.]
MSPAPIVDLVIEARWLIPVEPHARVLDHHAVVVDAGRIVALLPITEARQKFAPRERVELAGHALIPGLVNAHTH